MSRPVWGCAWLTLLSGQAPFLKPAKWTRGCWIELGAPERRSSLSALVTAVNGLLRSGDERIWTVPGGSPGRTPGRSILVVLHSRPRRAVQPLASDSQRYVLLLLAFTESPVIRIKFYFTIDSSTLKRLAPVRGSVPDKS